MTCSILSQTLNPETAQEKGRFQHSSFLAGGAVGAAGQISVDHGRIVKMAPMSGERVVLRLLCLFKPLLACRDLAARCEAELLAPDPAYVHLHPWESPQRSVCMWLAKALTYPARLLLEMQQIQGTQAPLIMTVLQHLYLASVQATMYQVCRIMLPSWTGLQTWGWTCQRWAAGSCGSPFVPVYERQHCLLGIAMLLRGLTIQRCHGSALRPSYM